MQRFIIQSSNNAAMKYSLTLLIAIISVSPILCQMTINFSTMEPKEVRTFLLNQDDSEIAKTLTMKHNRSRVSSYSFLALSVIMGIASSNATNPETDNKNSISLGLGAGVSFFIAGITGIAAYERLKKAKDSYSETTQILTEQSQIQIRDEAMVLNAIFKYPTPR